MKVQLAFGEDQFDFVPMPKSLVPVFGEFIAVNLEGVKDDAMSVELPRVIDAAAREIFGARSGYGEFLATAGPRYNTAVGFVGEAVAWAALTRAGLECVEATNGVYDLSAFTSSGKAVTFEAKASARMSNPQRFKAAYLKAQLRTPAKGGATHSVHVLFGRYERQLHAVMPWVVPMRTVRSMHRESMQFDKDKFVVDFDFSRGRTAKRLGLTKRPLTFDRLVADFRKINES